MGWLGSLRAFLVEMTEGRGCESTGREKKRGVKHPSISSVRLHLRLTSIGVKLHPRTDFRTKFFLSFS